MARITEAPADLPKANKPLIEGPGQAKVKIVGGMSEYALDNPPDIGDERTYIVKARCKKHEEDIVDGERRLVCQMEHTSIYEQGKVPIVDEPQPGLFDADDKAGGEDDDVVDAEIVDDDEAVDPEVQSDDEPVEQGKVTSLFSDGGDEA